MITDKSMFSSVFDIEESVSVTCLTSDMSKDCELFPNQRVLMNILNHFTRNY